MTDRFRAMCAELVELSAPTDSISQLAERLQKLNELAIRARALLDQQPVSTPYKLPEPDLTDAELANAAREVLDSYPYLYSTELPYFLSEDSTEYEPLMLVIRAAIEADRARVSLDTPELCDLHREMVAESVARTARSSLTQPETEEPTDEELLKLIPQALDDSLSGASRAMFQNSLSSASDVYKALIKQELRFARAVLANWDRQ